MELGIIQENYQELESKAFEFLRERLVSGTFYGIAYDECVKYVYGEVVKLLNVEESKIPKETIPKIESQVEFIVNGASKLLYEEFDEIIDNLQNKGFKSIISFKDAQDNDVWIVVDKVIKYNNKEEIEKIANSVYNKLNLKVNPDTVEIFRINTDEIYDIPLHVIYKDLTKPENRLKLSSNNNLKL